MKNALLKTLLLLLLLLSVAKLNAQVNIGADAAPKPFSVLELYAKYKTDPVDTYGGLRMPQLDTIQRNALSRTYGTDPAFYGLTIYNTTNNCLEYWNATKWVSLCLGTADIILECEPCDYDPNAPIPDGEPCICTPKEIPPCVVQSGQPYQIHLVTGFSYANVIVTDESTSSFMVIFDENNSMFPRTAIVRVTSNCTGEYKDFPFGQPGATCPGGDPFTVNTNTGTLCDNNGGVQAWVVNPEDGMNYIWSINGGVVHTGNDMQITRPGTYTIYAGLLGCTNPEPQVITIQLSPGTSPNAPFIRATNYGILCGPTGEVVLTASNVTFPVQWFQDGILYQGVYNDGTAGPPSANPLTVSGPSAAGVWFAVQINDPCASRRSSTETLTYSPDSPLPKPIIRINGRLLTDIPPPVVCKGGTLELEVVNASLFPIGTVYEWFFNGISQVRTTSPTIQTVDPNISVLVISVQASNTSGGCPSTSTSDPISVTYSAPSTISINNGARAAYICGSDPAILQATDIPGAVYEWFRDPREWFAGTDYNKILSPPPANTSRYDATEPDFYFVRYMDGNGCWSQVSASIQVIQSYLISIRWDVEPPSPVAVGREVSSSVSTSPTEVDNIIWSTSNTNAEIRSQRMHVASVGYTTVGTTVIKAEASNPCGDVSVEKTVVIEAICVNVTTVNISPTGTVIRERSITGVPKSGHTSTIFTATTPGTPQGGLIFTWYLNGSPVRTGTGASFATYTFNTPTTLPTPSPYSVYVTAKDTCTPSNTRTSTTTTVTIIDDLPIGSGRITGKACYDVKRTAGTTANSCMPLETRVDDFLVPNTTTPRLSFNYEFIPEGPYSGLTFSVTGDISVLRTTNPITQSGTIATITFRTDINTFARGRDKLSAFKLTIVAKYYPNSTSTGSLVQSTYVVSVQDCSCGCTVKSTLPAGWLTFQCHNLGANPNMTVAEQVAYVSSANTDATVYGDLYQVGRNTDGHQTRIFGSGIANNAVAGPIPNANFDPATGMASGTYAGRFITRSVNNWLATPILTLWNSGSESAPKKTGADPCPTGWRIPTQSEWGSIFRGGTTSGGPGTATANTWNWATRGFRISPDNGANYTLFLPAAGYRSGSLGTSVGIPTGLGRYHSSLIAGQGSYILSFESTSVNPYLNNTNGVHGYSVRCIAE